ncbi:restriction endonuclease [Nonomuraea glycinis]|uniref:restriction endonuclease n=1 Tax=Nonomuraea glycinis TaxID=2047744 RepID=UPI002E1294B7|nr:restriction endonuclease [Nonomuraea glycinis]
MLVQADDWDIAPGSGPLVRREIHEKYGGRRQGGIGPSRVTPNVLLFTDPLKGHQQSHYDGWGGDGCYHYMGEGQSGDQKMTQGNLAILNHRQDGRALRLFRIVPQGVQYIGRFELDQDRPYYITDAPNANDGFIRNVIMFRLRPVGDVITGGARVPQTPVFEPTIAAIPSEEQRTESTLMDSTREPHGGERREAALIRSYVDYMSAQGHTMRRFQILPADEYYPLYTDIYDATRQELIEAKGTTTREAMRMAIGQLMDYRRYLSPCDLSILVPDQPRTDLIDLCRSLGIDVIWPHGDDWLRASSEVHPMARTHSDHTDA